MTEILIRKVIKIGGSAGLTFPAEWIDPKKVLAVKAIKEDDTIIIKLIE